MWTGPKGDNAHEHNTAAEHYSCFIHKPTSILPYVVSMHMQLVSDKLFITYLSVVYLTALFGNSKLYSDE
jgi:hypothetical protein